MRVDLEMIPLIQGWAILDAGVLNMVQSSATKVSQTNFALNLVQLTSS